MRKPSRQQDKVTAESRPAASSDAISVEDTASLDEILARVYAQRGVDFSAYRRPMAERRVRAQMRRGGCSEYGEYLRRLATEPEETDRLIQCLTIKVSQFFRDLVTWEALRGVALADRVRQDAGTPLRVWSAGCGFGEEAYSLAILMEEMNLDGVRPGSGIYATDIDENALQAAREGHFSEAALAEVPRETKAAYFTWEPGHRHRAKGTLRARLQFLRHDLTTATAPPAGRQFELICCRNVLIYFRPDFQERVQRLLLESLVPGGYLCLGPSERLVPGLLPAVEVVDRQAGLLRRKGMPAGKGERQ